MLVLNVGFDVGVCLDLLIQYGELDVVGYVVSVGCCVGVILCVVVQSCGVVIDIGGG